MAIKQKTPNYLKNILVIFAIIILLLALISKITSLTEVGQELKQVVSQLDDNLVTKGLVTFSPTQTLTEPIANPKSPMVGKAEAPVTIYEFSSFGCPSSRDIQPVLKKLLELYPDQIKIVWKDLPIPELYPAAELAHLAGRCAQAQGKFFEYSALLWQNQNDFSIGNLEKLAKDVNLDSKKFVNCLGNIETKKIIDADVNEAEKLAISGTPHFYINTQEILGLATVEDFQKIIDIELNRDNE